MPQGAPVASGGAHLDADADRRVLVAEVVPPPAESLRPGCFQRVIQTVEDRMGFAVLVDQAIQAGAGAAGSGGHGHGRSLG